MNESQNNLRAVPILPLLLGISSALLLITIVIVWWRSYYVTDMIQWGSPYVVQEADWEGFGGVIGIRSDIILTAPGTLYVCHRRVQRPGDPRESAGPAAFFEGVEVGRWVSYRPQSIATSDFAAASRWPRSGFHWQTSHGKTFAVTTDVSAPMWFLAAPFVVLIGLCWRALLRHFHGAREMKSLESVPGRPHDPVWKQK